MPAVNIWAVLVATAASQLFGFAWYSVLFGEPWAVQSMQRRLLALTSTTTARHESAQSRCYAALRAACRGQCVPSIDAASASRD